MMNPSSYPSSEWREFVERCFIEKILADAGAPGANVSLSTRQQLAPLVEEGIAAMRVASTELLKMEPTAQEHLWVARFGRDWVPREHILRDGWFYMALFMHLYGSHRMEMQQITSTGQTSVRLRGDVDADRG